jgi:hypothetical protein
MKLPSKWLLPRSSQLPPWPKPASSWAVSSTASCRSLARSSISRSKSIRITPSFSEARLLNTASLPMATPCSLTPISPP